MEPMSLPKSFNVTLPEIYQIEATSACNFDCPMCFRSIGARAGVNDYLDVRLIDLMIDRGDFDGSWFVELQMAGEPLLHPHLVEIITKLKRINLLTGFSTNGSLLHSTYAPNVWQRSLKAISLVDSLTISVDAVDDDVYRKVRKASNPFTFSQLREVIELVLKQPTHPNVDLQIVELPETKGQLEQLLDIVKQEEWDVVVRTTPDCSLVHRSEVDISEVTTTELCLNPWLSVSIHANGDVVSCCFDFHGENKYGNLWKDSLAEIWSSSSVEALQQAHRFNNLPHLCKTCYMRSPVLIHNQFFMNWQFRNQRKYHMAPGRAK